MFTPDDLNKAISTALSSSQIQIPSGKKIAVMAVAHADGSVQGAAVFKQGDHWVYGGEVEIHDKKLSAGVSLSASW